MTAQVLPSGYDLIHTRDALQHLECTLIASALHNFAWSGAKYLLVGSYDGAGNRNISSGDYFDIDLRSPPFSLEPLAVLSENTPTEINKLQVGQQGARGVGWLHVAGGSTAAAAMKPACLDAAAMPALPAHRSCCTACQTCARWTLQP